MHWFALSFVPALLLGQENVDRVRPEAIRIMDLPIYATRADARRLVGNAAWRESGAVRTAGTDPRGLRCRVAERG